MWGRTAAMIAAALTLAPVAQAQPDDPFDEDWVAIAIAPGHAGGYGVAGTAQDAMNIAMTHCNDQTGHGVCVVADVVRFGCVAYATEFPDGTGSWATATGPDVNAASGAALGKLAPGSLVQFTRCWNPGG